MVTEEPLTSELEPRGDEITTKVLIETSTKRAFTQSSVTDMFTETLFTNQTAVNADLSTKSTKAVEASFSPPAGADTGPFPSVLRTSKRSKPTTYTTEAIPVGKSLFLLERMKIVPLQNKHSSHC